MHSVAAALITHEHGDHAKYWRQYQKNAIPLCATPGTIRALNPDSSEALLFTKIKPASQKSAPGHPLSATYAVHTLEFLAFPTPHDAAEPCGYLIHSTATRQNLIFLTDLANADQIHLSFSPEYIMVECNYNEESLSDCNASLAARIRTTHMELADTLRFLQSADLSNTRQIYLIHESASHARPPLMLKTLRAATATPIKFASDDLPRPKPFQFIPPITP